MALPLALHEFTSIWGLCFRRGEPSGFCGGSEFGEQGQWCGATFHRAGFDAVGAVGHAVRVAVEDSQRDQAFAGAERRLWRMSRVSHERCQHPGVGQHLQRGGESFSGWGWRPDASADCSSDWRTRL